MMHRMQCEDDATCGAASTRHVDHRQHRDDIPGWTARQPAAAVARAAAAQGDVVPRVRAVKHERHSTG